MDKIIGIGNALVDVLATLDSDALLAEMQLPKGSMQLIDDAKLEQIKQRFASMHTAMATGGSACNTMLALANLGEKPGLIGKIGCDAYGAFFKDNCRERGIEAFLSESALPSGIASTFISPGGERTFGTYLGASGTLRADELTDEMLRPYTYLYIEGYLVQNHDLILRAAQMARSRGMKVCLDLASYNIVEADLAFITSLVTDYVDIVFANEEEARAFTGKAPEEALHHIASLCEVAVVKVGARGVLIKRGDDQVQVPALEVERVVDTTAAGDFFAAGFLYGYLQGASLEQCGHIGSLLAGHVIQVVGTVVPESKWHEIKLNIHTILSE